jgi:hypothetical protein
MPRRDLRESLRPSRTSRADLGGRYLVFPAPSVAFDHRWSGAFEDVTGGSLPSGEPLVFGTP